MYGNTIWKISVKVSYDNVLSRSMREHNEWRFLYASYTLLDWLIFRNMMLEKINLAIQLWLSELMLSEYVKILKDSCKAAAHWKIAIYTRYNE